MNVDPPWYEEELVLRLLIAFSVWLAWALPAPAEPVYVAVASNFLLPAKLLAERYEETSGQQITISSGSTGKLYAQIVNGAPYAIFLAANASEPKRLETRGLAVAGSRFTYAIGRLVLWSLDPDRVTREKGADLIRNRDFARLAIPNPKIAPYGAAAFQTIRALGVDPDILGKRLVRGENVSQAYQFVAAGNADLGFVALSQLSDPERSPEGSHWLIPDNLHEPIEQQAVLLTRAAEDPAAEAFFEHLRSAEAAALIRAYGYGS